VTTDGSIAWSRSVPDGVYDVEVLGTPPESDGPSAAQANISDFDPAAVGSASLSYHVVSLIPPLVLHGLLFALPIWANAVDAVVVLVAGLVVVLWLLVEAGRYGRRRLASRRRAEG